jgi:hypothetical protein
MKQGADHTEGQSHILTAGGKAVPHDLMQNRFFVFVNEA